MSILNGSAYKQLILENVCVENYGRPDPTTDKEKAEFLAGIFKLEYQWCIDRKGAKAAALDYLQGLPSCVSFPFSNHDILQWAKEVKGEPLTTKQEDKLLYGSNGCSEYWATLADAFFMIVKDYV